MRALRPQLERGGLQQPRLIGASVAASLNEEHGLDWPLQLAVDALRREGLRDVGYATGLAAAVAARGQRDPDEAGEEDEEEPAAVRLDEILYLTNATGERAHGNPATFERLGLPCGWWNKGWAAPDDPDAEFYPLTKQEADVVQAQEIIHTSQGSFLCNYTTLVRGGKVHLPTLELPFSTAEEPDHPSRDAAQRMVHEKARLVVDPVEAAGGFVLIEEDAMLGDRHCLYVGVPVSFALCLGRKTYQDWLNTILGARS